MKGDENRIFFRNLERRPGEEELREAVETLKAAGAEIGDVQQAGPDDYYKGTLKGAAFRILFTGEEAIICLDNETDAEKILKVFE